ncbi:ATP-binding protein [Streptomyces sp. NPDC002669]|uniref:ATP-binding protein n=1 Tax=Streptomyces sp. NPDC002669 TaxID=3364658 RepID=UPI00368AB083
MTIQIAVLILICAGAVGAVWFGRSKAAAVKALTIRLEQVEKAQQEVEGAARAAREQADSTDRWWRQQTQNRRDRAVKALRQLVDADVPAALRGEQVSVESAAVVDEEAAELYGRLLAVAAGAARARAEDQESARLAVVALARRVQASAHLAQQVADQMAREHAGFSEVVEGCMRLDHMAAQQGRRAASLAVLCGEVPGQQWSEPLALVDVARAASARIEPYYRVDVTGDQTVAVRPEAAEGLIHSVAEFLANATQSSPPASRVTVQVSTVQRGAVIEIDDRGPGVTEHELSWMRATVSGQAPGGLAELGEVPQTGLLVVGQYVRRLGLVADVQESVYGGLRAVVRVPEELVAVVPLSSPAAATVNDPGHEVSTAAVEPVDSHRPAQDSGGLPRRRSLRGEAAPVQPSGPPVAEVAQESPEAAGNWMTSYFTGGTAASDEAATGINDWKDTEI